MDRSGDLSYIGGGVSTTTTSATNSVGATVDAIVHDLLAVAIAAASIFVKNPASQQLAANLANMATNVLLPIVDSASKGGGE